MTTPTDEVHAALDRIYRAWRENRPGDLTPLFHPDLVMVFPGFAGRSVGRDALVAGFEQFCTQATVIEHKESDRQIDVVGDVAVASYCYDMVYQLGGGRYHATGRDLWVFHRTDGEWLAVWRAMPEMVENPA